jgi:thiol:disulfide interchange protein DsbC
MSHRAAPLIVLALVLAACGGEPDSAASAPAQAAAEPLVTLPAEPVPEGDPRVRLAAMMPGVEPGDLRATPVAGIYELLHEGAVTYVTADGKYVFNGDLFQVTATGQFPNLTENRRREFRRQLLAAAPEQEMIVFGKASAPHTVTVFTDIDCQWCQHLHSQIADYNKLGIRVRYLAYPRSGPATDSWYKAEAVWCAKDRNAALTLAKRGESVKSASCDSHVAGQYELGEQVGVSATPAVVFDNGELVPGYLPPTDMLDAIKVSEAELAAQEKAAAN